MTAMTITANATADSGDAAFRYGVRFAIEKTEQGWTPNDLRAALYGAPASTEPAVTHFDEGILSWLLVGDVNQPPGQMAQLLWVADILDGGAR
jgi:hypothetical protein